MKRFILAIVILNCFLAHAQLYDGCHEIPEEYKQTNKFFWSMEKDGREYFKKSNWEWKLNPKATYADPLRVCEDDFPACIVVGYTCVHFNPFSDAPTEIPVWFRGKSCFVLQTVSREGTRRLHKLLYEAADPDPDVYFNNCRRIMKDKMVYNHTSGAGRDAVSSYNIYE